MCSFRFTRNFIRREDSREKRAPKFTVDFQCQMKDCPVKATTSNMSTVIIPFYDISTIMLRISTIMFRGDFCHQSSGFQQREIIGKERKGYI